MSISKPDTQKHAVAIFESRSAIVLRESRLTKNQYPRDLPNLRDHDAHGLRWAFEG